MFNQTYHHINDHNDFILDHNRDRNIFIFEHLQVPKYFATTKIFDQNISSYDARPGHEGGSGGRHWTEGEVQVCTSLDDSKVHMIACDCDRDDNDMMMGIMVMSTTRGGLRSHFEEGLMMLMIMIKMATIK